MTPPPARRDRLAVDIDALFAYSRILDAVGVELDAAGHKVLFPLRELSRPNFSWIGHELVPLADTVLSLLDDVQRALFAGRGVLHDAANALPTVAETYLGAEERTTGQVGQAGQAGHTPRGAI